MATAEDRIVQPFERCIVAVKAGKQYLGTGFVIDDNLALTCLHVVNARLKPRLESNDDSSVRDVDGLDVEFYALEPGSEHRCRKLTKCYILDEKGDVALLEWRGGIPEGVARAKLASLRDIKGRKVQTRGYPEIKENCISLSGDGTVDGTTDSESDNSYCQLWTLQSAQICPGFSGAPLFDSLIGSVVGMVQRGWLNERKSLSRNDKTLVAIGCRELRLLCRRYVPILQQEFVSEHKEALERLKVSVHRFLEINHELTEEIEKSLMSRNSGEMVSHANSAAKTIVDAVTTNETKCLNQLRLYVKQKMEQLANSRSDADLRVRQALSGLAMRVVTLLLGEDDFIRDMRVKVFDGATVLAMPSKSSIMVELMMSAVDGREPVLLLSSSANSLSGQRFKGRREIEPMPEEGIIRDEKVAEELVNKHMLKELRVEWGDYFRDQMPDAVRQELRDADEMNERWYMVVLEHDGRAEQSHSGEASIDSTLAEPRKKGVDPRIVEYLEKEFGALRQIQKRNLGVAPRGVTEWMGLLTSKDFCPPETFS